MEKELLTITKDGKIESFNHYPVITKNENNSNNPWDEAHKCFKDVYIEPNFKSINYDLEDDFKFKGNNNGYMDYWPHPKDDLKDRLIWHLKDEFSQLLKAKNEVIEKQLNRKIKIAIIDTGYHEGNPALPTNISNSISFKKGEEGGKAIDNPDEKSGENGHGTATSAILAGGNVNTTNPEYNGDFGAIPFAEIVPIRISHTVALVWSKPFVKAVEYAIDQGCEVISMSMAGAPCKAWAEVINKAYENGIVIVSAAGNSWIKGIKSILPKRTLYPARWDRVISATGVTFNHKPYVFETQVQKKAEGGRFMQGNHGPKKVMETAIAAYTPNTTWWTNKDPKNGEYFSLEGGGTSSATPQIAAAAALWICYNNEKINKLIGNDQSKKWLKVELVKRALFKSADTAYENYKEYYGNGILKAFNALKFFDENYEYKKAKKARVNFLGIIDLLGLLLRFKSTTKNYDDIDLIPRDEMFCTEILQELHQNEKLTKLLDYEDNETWKKEDLEYLKNELINSNVSNTLKEYLKNLD